MTDYPKALAALREARTKFDAEVARVAGPQTLQHRAEELSARVLDFLDALEAARGEAVAWYRPSEEGYDSAFRDASTVDRCTGHDWAGWVPLYAAPPAALAVPAGYVPVSALIEAREEVESWAAYADPYFRNKHDLPGVLAKIDALLASQAQQPAALAEQPAEQEPVAWLPSAEWTACVKLPVTVHVRQQRPGETHVSTREGITPVKPDDLIMRGVSGEEYPIGREIFERTYRLGEAPQPRRNVTYVCPVCAASLERQE